MVRIVFTVINDLSYDQRMQRICQTLADNGYSVLLVGRKLRSGLPLRQAPYKQHRMRLIFSRGKLFYLEYNFRLFFYLLFRRFDMVCGIDLDTILPCYFISKIRGKRCVYDAHEIFSEVPEVVRRPRVQRFWKWVERFAVTHITECYTVSHSAAAYFFERYQRRFEVIRNMPLRAAAPPQPMATQAPPVILYQGALNEGRGLEQLFDALPELDALLILAGEGDHSESLRRKAQAMQLMGKIEFAGRKTPDDLKRLTGQCTLGINLLENNGLNYFFSLANKFFDYVQAGVPQISMRFPEYEKLNDEFEVAVLIDDLRPDTIREAVRRLLAEKDFYFRLQENCKAAGALWTWQHESQKLLAFYSLLK